MTTDCPQELKRFGWLPFEIDFALNHPTEADVTLNAACIEVHVYALFLPDGPAAGRQDKYCRRRSSCLHSVTMPVSVQKAWQDNLVWDSRRTDMFGTIRKMMYGHHGYSDVDGQNGNNGQ